jgi:AmmeMemoRadiSam system protein A
MLSVADGKVLLKAARAAIESRVKKTKMRAIDGLSKFKEPAGVFVSIHKKGVLRGCVGLPYPTKPLSEAVVEAAVHVCSDRRFEPLTADELKKITIEVSVLTRPEELVVSRPDKLVERLTHEDGLIIRKGGKGALFLPQVWEQLPQPEEFLTQLCLKAGLSSNAWAEEGCRFYTFRAQIFSE